MSRRTRRQFRPTLDVLTSRIAPSTATNPMYVAAAGVVQSAPTEVIYNTYNDSMTDSPMTLDCPPKTQSSQAVLQRDAQVGQYDKYFDKMTTDTGLGF